MGGKDSCFLVGGQLLLHISEPPVTKKGILLACILSSAVSDEYVEVTVLCSERGIGSPSGTCPFFLHAPNMQLYVP